MVEVTSTRQVAVSPVSPGGSSDIELRIPVAVADLDLLALERVLERLKAFGDRQPAGRTLGRRARVAEPGSEQMIVVVGIYDRSRPYIHSLLRPTPPHS